MGKIDGLRSEIETIKKEIEQLQLFRQTSQTKKFLRQLFGERMNIQNQIRKLEQSKESKEKEKQSKRTNANKNRSHKMRRIWNYFRSIYKNYDTGKSVPELRSEFSKFKKGLETDVSEIIWRNPSP
jgi:chromosome segregation ATPase